MITSSEMQTAFTDSTRTVTSHSERRMTGVDFILRRAAEIHPHRLALDDRLRGRRFSYLELHGRSFQLARALARLGVRKSDLVAYAFFNEHASLEALFACTILGAVAVPLNNRLRAQEVSAYLSKHRCKAFIVNAELAGLADASLVDIIIVRERDRVGLDAGHDYEELLHAEPAEPLPPAASWEDPYMLAMTGGTTGGSKAAVWGHGGCMMDMLSVALHMRVDRQCRSICLTPTYHAAGLGWGVLPVLWQGGWLIMPPTPSFDARFVLDTVREKKIDYLVIVPAMIEPLLEHWDGDPISISSVCVCSAPTPPALRRKLAQLFPEAALQAGYGMTETFSMTVQTPGEFLAHERSVGEPSTVCRLRIVDDDGKRVPTGMAGHIVGRTLAMSMGYQLDEENTKAAYVVLPDDPERLEWMKTGDIGYLDEEGRLTIVDRAKDIVISGGENIASVEVESVAAAHPGVRECAVVGLPDAQWGERVVLVLVARDPGAEETLAREVIALCRAELAGYKVPKQVAFLPSLPRSAFGKVLKRQLPQAAFTSSFQTAGWRG